MKDTWGDVDTGGVPLRESEHHTKGRVEYKGTPESAGSRTNMSHADHVR